MRFRDNNNNYFCHCTVCMGYIVLKGECPSAIPARCKIC